MNEYCLVIDRGTTNIKAALYDMCGSEIMVVSQKCESPQSPCPGYAEQNMDLIWEHAKSAVRKLIKTADCSSDEIIAVSLCGQGNGLFLIDENGRPVRNGILSIDRRSNEKYGEWMADRILEKILSETHGVGLDPQSPVVLLKWISENEPETLKNAKYFLSSKDWVRFCLTSEIYTDRTEVSANGLINLASREYTDKVFEYLGIPECNLLRAPLKESFEISGYVTAKAAQDTGLKKGTPVITGAHDICACSYGTGGTNEKQLAVITGTLGINIAISRKLNVKCGMLLNSILPDMWSAGSTSGGCSASLNWFIRLLCEKEFAESTAKGESIFSHLEPLIEQAGPSSVICHPYLFGGALTNMNVRASLCNISSENTKTEILRGIYQGLVYAQCASILELPNEPTDIYLVGGCSNSPTLAAGFATVLGKPINLPAFSEAACRGAALCAIKCLQNQTDTISADMEIPVKKTYEPDSSLKSIYLEQFERFCELSKSIEETMSKNKIR